MSSRSVERLLFAVLLLGAFAASCAPRLPLKNAAENAAYRLSIEAGPQGLRAVLEDKRSGLRLADGPMVYRADAAGHENPAVLCQLADATVSAGPRRLTVRGKLAGLEVEHAFSLPADKPVMDETLRLTNAGPAVVSLPDLECGFTRVLKDETGQVPADLAGDRWVAVPHRKRAEAPKDVFLDFSAADLADKPGFEPHPDAVQDPHYQPSRHRYSDAWAWTHGGAALGLYKYSQEAMLFSVISTAKSEGRTLLRFGGTAMIMGEPAVLTRLRPGQSAEMGLTRYETSSGGFREAMYGFRRFLDERGCRFPADFDPPVHWEQLYDMEGAWDHRAGQYTKAAIEREAQKGMDYSCEAIYLDPGWDTKFASFIWGEAWLGPMDAFVREMRDRYGLKLSLHTPLATWMSLDIPMGPPSIDTWPAEARLMPPPAPATPPGTKPAPRRLPAICLGSRQYLDAAEKRLLDLCAAGATFLMYDGNFWNGGCLDPNHGHPVPYTFEDHIRANVDLARRIHAKYPRVLIEMHDMISGGNPVRHTPLYYTYGLPGSWDENWGYELMWDSMADITSLRCLSLYYSNLSCNIPFYLHVNLRGDNTDAIVLWWYASTCRHLGIGGTAKDPAVVAAQKAAMKRYRAAEALYKRGEFYGLSEEVHAHVLGNRVAVNVFNLDGKPRTIEGRIPLAELGLDPAGSYVFDEPWARAADGMLVVKADLGPWGAKMAAAGGLAEKPRPEAGLMGQRFLTLNTVIRVNQIEVARDRNEGVDERALHTPARVVAFREAVERGFPGARITWAFSWLALHDPSPDYVKIREIVVGYHRRYGDEITFIPGGYFANAYNSTEQVNRDLHDALARVAEIVGNGYRPKSVVAGFLSAKNLKYLAEVEDIHVCQGTIWSQYAIDNQDGDGSVCYPYYPSTEHFCKPAQGKGDLIDCVNLDGWTVDFLAARREGFAGGFNSRMGVGPIETLGAHGPEKGLAEMMHTTAVHFDRGFALNGFAWVTNCWELCLPYDVAGLTRWLSEVRRRWPDTRLITQGEFGLVWRAHFRENDFDYRFEEIGSGIGGSDADKRIRWFMNKTFRLALLGPLDKPGGEMVIDLTRYDLKAAEPASGTTRNWSLMGEIHQKRTRPQDAPVPLGGLSRESRALVEKRYAFLFTRPPDR